MPEQPRMVAQHPPLVVSLEAVVDSRAQVVVGRLVGEGARRQPELEVATAVAHLEELRLQQGQLSPAPAFEDETGVVHVLREQARIVVKGTRRLARVGLRDH
eukprot:5665804-Prymnesium_polylepis.1